MKRLNAHLAQLNPRLRDVEGNIETAKGILARHDEADLFVFPELFLGGYTTDGIDDLALDLDGPEVGETTRPGRFVGGHLRPRSRVEREGRPGPSRWFGGAGFTGRPVG